MSLNVNSIYEREYQKTAINYGEIKNICEYLRAQTNVFENLKNHSLTLK